jgi:hypothetical protein
MFYFKCEITVVKITNKSYYRTLKLSIFICEYRNVYVISIHFNLKNTIFMQNIAGVA